MQSHGDSRIDFTSDSSYCNQARTDFHSGASSNSGSLILILFRFLGANYDAQDGSDSDSDLPPLRCSNTPGTSLIASREKDKNMRKPFRRLVHQFELLNILTCDKIKTSEIFFFFILLPLLHIAAQ